MVCGTLWAGPLLGGPEWYIDRAQVPSGLEAAQNARVVRIAIVDDGVRSSHTELRGLMWRNPREIAGNRVDDDGNGYVDDVSGWDFGDGDADADPPLDRLNEFYHGTHVAGIIGRIFRHAYGDRAEEHLVILPVKALADDSERMILSEGYQGMEYAVSHGADIIVCAWSLNVISRQEREVLDRALAEGVLIVAASGNLNDNRPSYPAAHPAALAVSAHDELGRKLPQASYGAYVDLIAPGADIRAASSHDDEALAMHSGTSTAAAIVAASAGILKLQNPDYSTRQLRAALVNSATAAAQNAGFAGQLGSGKLHLRNALQGGYSNLPDTRLTTRGYIAVDLSRQGDWQMGPLSNCEGIRISIPMVTTEANSGILEITADPAHSETSVRGSVEQLQGEHYIPLGVAELKYDPGLDGQHGELLIEYRAVPVDLSTLYCQGMVKIVEPGLIGDGSGAADYTPNSDCKWLITGPKGKRVRVEFLEFDTEAGVDKLYAFNGSGTHETILGIYSGASLPPECTSWGNQLLLWFVSDSQIQRKGWQASISFVCEEGGNR